MRFETPHEGPFQIPKISDEKIEQLLEQLQPLVLRGGAFFKIPEKYCPRRFSFPFRDTVTPLGEEVVEGRSFKTLHTFGYRALFKPAVAEALAFLPEDVSLDNVVGFTVEGPEDAADLNFEREATNNGVHVAKCTLWERK